jgi:chromosome segregation ATPase
MKPRLLTIFLIVLAVVLSLLSTYQWWRGTQTHQDLQALRHTQLEMAGLLQQQTNRIQNLDLQIAELVAETTRYSNVARTNENTIVELRTEVGLLENTNQWLRTQLQAYTSAFNQATNQLSEAYDNIRKQNELVQQLARERDEFAVKLNQSTEERNRIVAQYNELVARIEQIQPQVAPPQP